MDVAREVLQWAAVVFAAGIVGQTVAKLRKKNATSGQRASGEVAAGRAAGGMT